MFNNNNIAGTTGGRNGSQNIGDTVGRKDAKDTQSEDPQQARAAQIVMEEEFLAEATDDTEPYPGDNDGGSVSMSRATSISELTEEGSELPPAKRARSNRSISKDGPGNTRASSPLSVVDTDDAMNGRGHTRKRQVSLNFELAHPAHR
jgi:hypothetical protein